MRSNRIAVRFEREIGIKLYNGKFYVSTDTTQTDYVRLKHKCRLFQVLLKVSFRLQEFVQDSVYRSMLLNRRWLCCCETFDSVWRYFGCHSWGHSWRLVDTERILLKSHSGKITTPPGQELTGQNVNISRVEKLGSTLISRLPRTNHWIFFFSFLGSLSIKDS